ncbi:methionine biosynthesis protein MetW, partial [Acinetobacter baumannii]
IGRHAIVSFPNFGHWRVRWYLATRGRMPHAPLLNHHWYDTPNIHLCTIDDFVDLAAASGIVVERGLTLDRFGRASPIRGSGRLANLF